MSDPGYVIEIPKLATTDTIQQTELMETAEVKITQLTVPAGSSIPTYEAAGQAILHCLDGRISINAIGQTHELRAGRLLYLTLNEPFSILANEHASVLLTVIALKRGDNVELIGDG